MKYDFVVFGASGFTGQFVVEFLARAVSKDNDSLSWSVSGRSESKLRAVLEAASQSTGLDLAQIPIIICDTSDDASVLSMASQARLVLNCVGPYRFYGEQVVSACVKAGAHHLDISGEPQFLEKMQLKFNEEARAKGVFVVGACGFDSIPSDVGQMLLTKKMGGDVNSVETYLTVTTPDGVPGPCINFGTWQSAIYGFSKAHELKPLRRQLYPERLPSLAPKLVPRGALFWSEDMNSYCMPFPGSDRSVMMRTQRARYHSDGERPAQIQSYFTVSGILSAVMIVLAGLVFGILAKTGFGRRLLESYPRLFSFGAVSKEGPSKKMAENTNFVLTLIGLGWKDKKPEREDKPSRKVTVTVSGKNVGYGSTCECMVQAGMVILKERELMPKEGGVYTPGYAFANTTLVERLNFQDVPFQSVVKDLQD